MGGAFRCALAIQGYPTSTEDLALLRSLGEKRGVTLVIYARQATPSEERQIIQNATSRNRLERSNTNDFQQSIAAEANLQDVTALVARIHRDHEPLIHCAVYLSIAAGDEQTLRTLKDEVLALLSSAKLAVDVLMLRQQDGFHTARDRGFLRRKAGADRNCVDRVPGILPTEKTGRSIGTEG